MRLHVVWVAALFLVPTLAASASTSEPEDGLAVTIARIVGKGVYVTWTPAPGAVMYDIYRGADLDNMVLLGQTPMLEYADWNAPNVDLWYTVVSKAPASNVGEILGPMKGSCIALRGVTGVAITLANCMPSNGPN